jgi:predicted flavoprotein YhiN
MISSEGATNALPPNERPKLLVNWTGETEEIWKARLAVGHLAPRQVIREHLPSRLAQALCREMPYADRRLAELPRADRQDLLRLLTAYPLPWASHEGYRKAEVTGGGVPLEAINTATMELKSHPGLFLCGEILDVFGRIGGFNFYWAWVTGRLAGLSSTTAGSKGLTTTLSPATKGIRLSV